MLGAVFTPRGARLVAKSALDNERSVRGDAIGPRARPNTFLVPWGLARAPSTGIPARVGMTPGMATCQLYEFDGSKLVLGSRTETLRNPYGAAVGPLRFVGYAWWYGAWWVATEECVATTAPPAAANTATSTSSSSTQGTTSGWQGPNLWGWKSRNLRTPVAQQSPGGTATGGGRQGPPPPPP